MQMEKGKLDKGYSSISGPRVVEKAFSDMNITGTGFGSGSSVSTDMDSFVSKPKGDNIKFSLSFLANIWFTLMRSYCSKLFVLGLVKTFTICCLHVLLYHRDVFLMYMEYFPGFTYPVTPVP